MRRTFEVVQGLGGLDTIRGAWNTLTGRTSHPRYFHMYSWYKAYVECLETSPGRVVFVLTYQGEDLEAIFPFRKFEKRRIGLRLRVFQSPHHKHMDLYDVVLNSRLDHRSLLSELLQFLNEHRCYKCDVIQFGNVLEDSATLHLLQGDDSLRTTVFPTGFCDYLPVLSEENLLKAVSHNFRGNLRKARNKLGKRAKVEFLSTRAPETLQQYFPHFLEIEASGWKGGSGTRSAIKLHPSLTAFYGRLLERFSDEKRCEINLLKVDGWAIAGQFALIVGETMYVLKIGYDEQYAELSPGNLLLAHVLDRLSTEDGIRYVNLITHAAWHTSWRPSRYQVFQCSCYSSSPVARLTYFYQQLRRQMGSLSSAPRSHPPATRRISPTR